VNKKEAAEILSAISASAELVTLPGQHERRLLRWGDMDSLNEVAGYLEALAETDQAKFDQAVAAAVEAKLDADSKLDRGAVRVAKEDIEQVLKAAAGLNVDGLAVSNNQIPCVKELQRVATRCVDAGTLDLACAENQVELSSFEAAVRKSLSTFALPIDTVAAGVGTLVMCYLSTLTGMTTSNRQAVRLAHLSAACQHIADSLYREEGG